MRNIFQPLFRALFLIFLADFGAAEGEVQSVGKLRSAAEVAFSKGDVDQALRLWGQVIGLEPQNENNFYKRFRVYLRQQKLKEALSDLSAALSIKPDFEAVLAQRAKLQLKMGRCHEAKTDFDKLRVVNAQNKDLAVSRDAEACVHAAREADRLFAEGQHGAARDQYTNALRSAESSSSLMMQRALCHFYLGDHYEAIADTGELHYCLRRCVSNIAPQGACSRGRRTIWALSSCAATATTCWESWTWR